MFEELSQCSDVASINLYNCTHFHLSQQNIWREAVNANLSLPLLPLGTLPLSVVPTTGHGKELEEPWGRKGEQNTQFEFFFKVTRRVWLSTEHCQSFVINATSKLVTKLQATRDWLIQHSNRISKLSGLSSQIEMLDWGFSMKLSRAIVFCDCKIAIL